MSEPINIPLFVRESNHIEGIYRDPSDAEITAHRDFLLNRDAVTVERLQAFVDVVAPGHVLRERAGLNVRVGRYVAPSGGPSIRRDLESLLHRAHEAMIDPYLAHLEYENLHPFTDGNGRSGRMLWLWMMGSAPLGFLHHFYYQTLEHSDDRS